MKQNHKPVDQMTTEELQMEVTRLRDLINKPHTDEFFESVKIEAAHQLERWGTDHDDYKTPADWFWVAGWLLGKAVHASDNEKRLHHIITTAALLLNWFQREKQLVGDLFESR